jgi:hypothetical protein
MSNLKPVSPNALDPVRALLDAASQAVAGQERLDRLTFQHGLYRAALEAIASLEPSTTCSDSEQLAAIKRFAANTIMEDGA